MNKDNRNIRRSFGGIISNNLKDFTEDNSTTGAGKINRAFHDKMLKAYLRGDQYFSFGYKRRDKYGKLVPNTFAVLMNN
jgi:hypothetical protein